ncbi:MAG TPA: rhomboid family intramembrane serine protease [Tepidisphaeraceae bacterium]|nr:rhomboid family intramembrane serine protease [Tepidisphaeraceae bacterium]
MRLIGSIPTETDAKRFGDYLLAAGMRNSVEEGASGWAVWVEHDDHLEAAKAELETFRANPGDAKYNGVARKAEKIRSAEDKRQERLRKRYHDVRTSWGSTRQWAQPVTIGLILLSLLAAAATAVGESVTGPAMNALRIQSVQFVEEGEHIVGVRAPVQPLHDVRRGQVWRLITPIFLHFGPIHLIFNMFWLFDLGGQIERARGSLFLAALVLAGAIVPNLAEYFWSGPLFGGMSGVVYALFGYVWIKGKYEPHLNMGVSQQTVLIMMVWLVICMIGVMGQNIANAAHLIGLMVGVAMAYGPIELRRMRRRLKS